MHKDQNPAAGRVMDYLEIASRYILLNFFWISTVFPVAFVFFLGLRQFFGLHNFPWVAALVPIAITSPAMGGLFYAANQLAHGRDGGFVDYWQGMKIYFWPSYRWVTLNLGVAFLFSVNIWFYGNAPWEFAPYIKILFIAGAAFWAAIQTYTFPFMIEQEKPSIKTALRNSFLAVARFPLRSFGFLVVVVSIAFLSAYLYYLPWVIITVSFLAYLMNKNTLTVLEKFIAMQQAEEKSPK